MIKNTTMVEMTDLLAYAKETFGTEWPEAHKVFERDHVLEDGHDRLFRDEIDLYSWSEWTKQIVRSFMVKEGLEEMILTE